MFKKLIPFVIAIIILSFFTGCKGTKDPSDEVSDLTPEANIPKLENKKVSIMLNVDRDSLKSKDSEEEPNAFNRAFEKWKKEYGTEVEVVTVEWDSFTSYLATAAASDQMPDVVYGGLTWYPRWPANKLVQPLDGLLDLDDEMWNKEIMDQFKMDGKSYVAFAQRPEKFYIAYNETKFNQKGETTPLEHFQNGNWNWTQFVKTAKNMSDPENDEYGFNSWNLSFGSCIYPLLQWGDDGKLEVVARNNNTVRWFTEVSNLYRSRGARFEDLGNWRETFPAGKDAMVGCTPEEYVRFRQRIASTGGDELAIAPMPVFDPTGESESITTANVYGLSITSKSKNPKGAAAFIDLYYRNWNAIEKARGIFGLMETYLTPAEKEALLAVDDIPVVLNFTSGVGNNKTILQTALEDINNPNSTKSAQAYIDEITPLLEAELDEFYRSLGR